MSFKNNIVNLLPFFLLKKVAGKRYPISKFIQYDSSLPDIPKTDSLFKNIISVQGFGFSGSGAVVDYLREYSNCLALGSVDADGSLTKGNNSIDGEINILRHAGGLFEIEKYINDSNLFTKDALIKRFKRLVNGQNLFNGPEAKLLLSQFYNQLIDFEIDTRGFNDYNSHLANPLCPDSNIIIMRQFSVADYRSLCQRFLTSLFNLLYQEGKQNLILDQLCGDFNYNLAQYTEYIPNLKIILVYRDPRDTYAYAIKKDVLWIPHNSVVDFIKWYGINIQNVCQDSNELLMLSFEDLVLNYEKCTQRIKSYLCLDEKEHTNPYSCLVPSISAKNIAIWKQMSNYKKEMDEIHSAFPSYSFEG